MIVIIVLVISILVYYVHYKFTRAYKYWEKRNVKGPTPELLFGNFRTMFFKKDSITSLVEGIYNQYPEEKLVGLYQAISPTLLIRDPDIIKKILVKDFVYFTDRGFSLTKDTLSKNLFSSGGEEWKAMRQKLTPLFSTSKLRHMMPLITNAVKQYIEYLDNNVDKNVPQEVRDLNMKYTLKVISSVAFGIDINTFVVQNEFVKMSEVLLKRGLLRRLAMVLDSIFPGIFAKLGVSFMPNDIRNFFIDLVRGVIKEREGKPKVRRDFMDLMIELKEQGMLTTDDGKEADFQMSVELITAQALVFYAAGFETSASTMSFLLYELSFRQDIQDRCYEEVKRVMKKYNEELTYEALIELEFITMAYEETLRKHPPAGILMRDCVMDYQIPELNLTVEKGTKIFVPLTAIQRDPKYFPDPEKFDPDRFAPEKKDEILGYTYMPFGEGPRNCIGLRLAKVQSLLGIAHFLHNYRVLPSEKTPKTMEYDPLVILLKSKHGTWLKLEPRT